MMIRRIVCGIDFSACSEHALEYAIELARHFEANVHLVHVRPISVHTAGVAAAAPSDAALMADVDRACERALAQTVARIHGISVTSKLLVGVPYREITRTAEELPAELIVIGTHGRSGLDRLLLGSVATRVVRSSLVPVLTVPPAR
jgi:nucleotide-binding universal stress UspA family protein